MQPYLAPSKYIDFDHPLVAAKAAELAIVVVGGLVSSLSLSLFLLPMLYRLFAPPVRVIESQPASLQPSLALAPEPHAGGAQ